ncbi:hypothetical protein V5O48_003309 [Marasmius crinis-equi]|uniref:Uncharacterized protein n=1 Tax=Marasmius crinis-equi TaxID=585013 RepID=A0ABR3FT90_9AGAR
MSEAGSRASTVLYGTLATSAIGAFATGVHGIFKQKPNYGVLSFGAAVNGGITAATFFSIREYAISPVINTAWEGNNTTKPDTSPQRTISEIRTDKLLDTGISGFVTGGMIRGLTAGPRVALPAAVTVGTACTALQFLFNEVKVSRLQYLSKRLPQSEQTSAIPPSTSLSNSTTTASSNTSPKPQETSWTSSLLKFVGIRVLSDEEYLTKLYSQRDGHLKRIAELEAQIDKERKGENG